MARDYLSRSEENIPEGLPRFGLRNLAWFMAILIASFLAWEVTQVGLQALMDPTLFLFIFLALIGLQIGLVFSLERAFSGIVFDLDWRYRLSFLGSAGLGAAFTALAYSLTSSNTSFPLVVLFLITNFLSALAGSVLLTSLVYGLWEDNSPPPEYIHAQVIAEHQRWMKDLPPVPWAKRSFDILLAVLGLLFSSPVWLLSFLFIWFENPGPVLFIKNSVGKGGANFHQFKFRTMVWQAERNTGPVLASENDTRVLRSGRLLRKTALDELPQLLNILKGEMSFVGPRPQRTVLVRGYLERMPEYAERHRVLPGLAGLAQVAGDYYLTPRQKLRYDRLYIRYATLRFDLKLIALAFLITFWLRWKKNWNGRLPRNWLRFPGG